LKENAMSSLEVHGVELKVFKAMIDDDDEVGMAHLLVVADK
jgi:hypothetical protein